jgi:hypothetical protein
LISVHLENAAVTDAGLARFRKEHPQIEIDGR